MAARRPGGHDQDEHRDCAGHGAHGVLSFQRAKDGIATRLHRAPKPRRRDEEEAERRSTLDQCPCTTPLFPRVDRPDEPCDRCEREARADEVHVGRARGEPDHDLDRDQWQQGVDDRRDEQDCPQRTVVRPACQRGTPPATSNATGNASSRKRRKASQPGAERIARPAIARTAAGVQSASTYSPTETPRAVHTLATIAATNQSPIAAAHTRHAHPTLLLDLKRRSKNAGKPNQATKHPPEVDRPDPRLPRLHETDDAGDQRGDAEHHGRGDQPPKLHIRVSGEVAF